MSLREQLAEFCPDFEDKKLAYFSNSYNPRRVEKIAETLNKEFLKLNESEKQHFTFAEILLDATMDAILEIQVFEGFKEKTPDSMA